MGMLEELGAYVHAQIPSLVVTQNLFYDYMPDLNEPGVVDPCVVLYEYEGEAPVETFQQAAVAWELPRLQVVVRADTPDAARDLCKLVWNALNLVTNTTLSGTQYLRIQPMQSPFLYQRDQTGPYRRTLYAANFRVQRVSP